MNKAIDTDVLIVGAGPTGLTLACELARRGVDFMIIDKKSELSKKSKASAIQARTMELFHFMGIASFFQENGVVSEGTNFYKGNQTVVSFSYEHLKCKSPYPYVLMIPQNQTELILQNLLHSYHHKVQRNQELLAFEQNSNIIKATIQASGEQYEITTKYLISCEGAKSFIRNNLPIQFKGGTYEEIYLATDANISWDLDEKKFHGWFHKDGLFGAGILPHSKQWRLFANMSLEEYATKQALLTPSKIIAELVQKRLGYQNLTVDNPTWEASYKVNCRMANTYQIGNIFLAGDAAHIHSPVGGQGMNTGIQDAYNLAWKLALVLNNNASTNLLRTYEQERLPLAKWVLSRTHFITKLFTIKNYILQFCRENITKLLFSIPFIHNRWVYSSSQLNIHYRRSPLSKNKETNPFNQFKAGDRIPQTFFTTFDKHTIDTFSLLQCSHFILLIFVKKINPILLNQHIELIKKILPTDIFLILPKDSTLDHLTGKFKILIDTNNSKKNTYHIKNEGILLVRPDGYVGFYAPTLHWQAFNKYIELNYSG